MTLLDAIINMFQWLAIGILIGCVVDLYDKCKMMKIQIEYLDNNRKVFYDTLYEHLKSHTETDKH